MIAELDYPCQQTMQLIKLADDMVSYDPAKRPNINKVFEALLEIIKQGKQ